MFPTLGVSHDRKPDTNVIQLSKCQIIYCRKNEKTREGLIDRQNRHYCNSKNMSKFAFADIWFLTIN